jgi:hypothetical protein
MVHFLGRLVDQPFRQPFDRVAALDTGIVFSLFGRELSMGKGQGLMGIVTMVRHEEKQRLK